MSLKEEQRGRTDLLFEVIDTGIGIPKEKMENIFESFTQVNASTTRQYGGTGLGLAITKRLLTLQNSTLQIRSQLGEGSNFYFRLKLKKGKKEDVDEQGSASSGEFSLKGKKILLVEDNKINQMVALRFLNGWELEVEVAENGLEALEKMDEGKYDLILMDLQMPEMDGYTASKKIRESNRPIYREIPIIALTASTLDSIQGDIKSVGMDDFVLKPFVPADLHRALVKHLYKTD